MILQMTQVCSVQMSHPQTSPPLKGRRVEKHSRFIGVTPGLGLQLLETLQSVEKRTTGKQGNNGELFLWDLNSNGMQQHYIKCNTYQMILTKESPTDSYYGESEAFNCLTSVK